MLSSDLECIDSFVKDSGIEGVLPNWERIKKFCEEALKPPHNGAMDAIELTNVYKSKPPEPFDIKELVAMLDNVGEPQGVVLLPNGSGFEVFQFPSVLLKGAISLMQCKFEPKTQPPTALCCPVENPHIIGKTII